MDKPNEVPLNHSGTPEQTEGKTYEAIHPERDTIQADKSSVRTASLDTARNSQQWNEKGYSNPTGGVDVSRAEHQFAELSKELSRTSNVSRRLSRVQSRQSRKNEAAADIEKIGAASSDASSEEPFDLEATLRGSKEEDEAAGIKSKRIGVVWEDLTVSGIGESYQKAQI